MGSKRSKRTEVSKAELAIRCTSPRAGGGQFMEDLTFFPRPPERYSIQIEGATHHLRSCLIPLFHFTYLTS